MDNETFSEEIARNKSMLHDEFATFDTDIAYDAPVVPLKPRQIEEIHNDAQLVMGVSAGVSPALAPVKSLDDFENGRKMGG